jgi:hypothetical protein
MKRSSSLATAVAPTASVVAGLVLVRGARHLRHDIATVSAGDRQPQLRGGAAR